MYPRDIWFNIIKVKLRFKKVRLALAGMAAFWLRLDYKGRPRDSAMKAYESSVKMSSPRNFEIFLELVYSAEARKLCKPFKNFIITPRNYVRTVYDCFLGQWFLTLENSHRVKYEKHFYIYLLKRLLSILCGDYRVDLTFM